MQPTPSPQSDKSDLSHRLMLAAGLVAAAGFALVSIAANLRFGISLASMPFDRAIYGTLSVAADLMKIVLPLAVMILWRKGERIFALAGAVFWIGTIAYSLSAAIGFAASTRSHAVALKENLIESRNAWEAKITRIEGRLDLLGTARPAHLIQAEIHRLLRTPGTEDCKVVNGPVTREVCPKVDQLRQELAVSNAAAQLEADLVADRKALSTVPVTAAAADPQSAILSRFMSVQEESIRSAIGVLIACLVEFGSALGFSIMILAGRQSGSISGSPSRSTGQPSPMPADAANGALGMPEGLAETPKDLVTRWAFARLDIISSGIVQAEHAYQDFCVWCSANEATPLTPQMFGRRFTKVHAGMGGKKIKRCGRAYYSGVALQNRFTTQFLNTELTV